MILYPNDAPFSTTVIPRGADRFLTQEEVDAANTLYPVPPYGETYVDPNPPPAPPIANVSFLRLTSVVNGVQTGFTMRNEDMDKVEVDDIIVIWPIICHLGVADDIGVRPVRVLTKVDEKLTVNYDSTGIDTADMTLVGIKYRDNAP